MKTMRWYTLCFLLFYCQNSGGLNVIRHVGLISIFNENVSVVDTVETLIPTLNSENVKCREHSRLYLKELKKFKLWATEMFDSTAKFPSGILYGSTYNLGSFDQCVEVKVAYSNAPFTGKYCLAKFTVNPPNYVEVNHNIDYDRQDYKQYFNISAWEKITVFSNNKAKGSRNDLYFSFCLPSSCTNDDLKTSLYKLVEEYSSVNDFDITVDVNERSCQVKKVVHYSLADISFILVITIFVMKVTLASLYDLLTQTEDFRNYRLPCKLHNVLMCFSFPNNLKKIASEGTNEDGLDCLAGLKVLSMFFIIMGHRCMFTFGSPLANPKFVEEMYTKVEATVLLNGPIIVDTFFVISGFLATYLTIALFGKSKRSVNIAVLYVHRIIRMLPLYAIVLAFYCTVFVKMGSGPFWQERVGLEQERCVESWWTNVLYINNYVNVDKLCMFQSWYLTCDMHYYLFIPLLVWLLQKQPKVGLFTLFTIIFASIFTVFAVVYISNEDAILLLYMKLLKDPVLNKTFRNIYIRSHLRATPYLVGIATGYIKYKMTTSNCKMSKTLLYIGWTLCIFFSIATVYTAFIFYLPQVPHVSVFSALYASMHHFSFSLCIAWMIIAVSSGHGSWIEPILSWKPLKFLSRITYATFLSHGAIQIYTAATIRGPKYASIFTTIYDTFGDITLAYIVGFILSIYFEAPIIGLEKIIFGRGEKEKQSNHKKVLEELVISMPKIKTISQQADNLCFGKCDIS